MVLCMFQPVFGQETKGYWGKYIVNSTPPSSRSSNAKSDYWIIETVGDIKSSDLKFEDFQVVKKLEADVYLIQSKNYPTQSEYISNIWQANNLWKLATINATLLENKKNETYVIQIDSNNPITLDTITGLTPISEDRGIYTYTGNLEFVIDELASHPAVLSVTQESFQPKTESLVRGMNLNTNKINQVHHDYPEYDGSGETISIQENHYDILDIDLIGRNVPNDISSSETNDAHATDMATIIAGAGNSFVEGKGVLRSAQITSSDFLDVLPDPESYYEALNIKVQNHSYGTIIEPYYGVQAHAFDVSAYENPYLLHIFSSGNSGTENASEGNYAAVSGWANLTGNYKMSKNTLSIGAVDFENEVLSFSSRGPAYDGRIKPELVAFGQDGSSNAAALVSGVSGLLHQAYNQETGLSLPSALLKAYLVNTAEDAGESGLDHVTGYGSINAHESVKSLLAHQHFLDTVDFEEDVQFDLELPSNIRKLSVTLCWTDPPAFVGNTSALINDLDLKITTPDGQEILPWVLNTEANEGLLTRTAFRSADHLNNLEHISIDNPKTGTYRVQVSGFDVPEGSQAFALTYHWDEEDVFEWNYPTSDDPVPFDGGSSSYLYWTSTFEEETTGVLEYSFDGEEWIVLSSRVALSKGFWDWQNIPSTYEQASLRMTILDNAFESDTFIVSRPLSLGLGFDCADSIMLQWNHVADAIDYEISNLGPMYLESYATTVDTFLIVNKSDLTSNYISVRANLPDERTTISSYTVDHTELGGTCFVSFIYQEELPEEGINIHLELGTTLGVASVRIDRKVEDDYVLVDQINDIDSKSITVFDDRPNEGFNEHLATVTLMNGEEVTISAGDAYYFSETQLLVFPNPISNSDYLSVFRATSSNTPVFKLYNSKGQEVLLQNTPNTKESIYIGNLVSGVYFYVMDIDNKQTTGRLIVD